MKKGYFVLFVCFEILTFAGAIFVLTSRGQSAGFAVIPMLFALFFLMQYRNSRQ